MQCLLSRAYPPPSYTRIHWPCRRPNKDSNRWTWVKTQTKNSWDLIHLPPTPPPPKKRNSKKNNKTLIYSIFMFIPPKKKKCADRFQFYDPNGNGFKTTQNRVVVLLSLSVLRGANSSPGRTSIGFSVGLGFNPCE